MKKNALSIAFFVCVFSVNAQNVPTDSSDADSSESVRVYTLKELTKIARNTSADTTRTGKRRNFLAFNFGSSMAVGRFRKSEDRSLGDGFAQNGFAFQMEYASFWNKNIGLGFSAGTFANRLDERQLLAFFPVTGTTDPSRPRTITDVKPWRTYHLFVGPYLTLPFENLSIDFKFLGGLAVNQHPGGIVTTTERDSNGEFARETTEIRPVSNIATAYNFGAGLRLKLSEGTQLKVGVDYVHSFPKTSYAFNSGRRIEAGRQSLSVLNLSWGLAINVGRRK